MKTDDRRPGVNLIGAFDRQMGLAEAARATRRALSAAEIPFEPINWPVEDTPLTPGKYPINIIQYNPPLLEWFLIQGGDQVLLDRYNIGVWFWESQRFPDDWKWAFGLLDEIWAPSTYCREAFAKVSPLPVSYIPVSVSTPEPAVGRRALGLPEDAFIFLFIFDMGSSYDRKNPVGLIEAFSRAFGTNGSDPLLVIKTSNQDVDSISCAELRDLVDQASNIILIDRSIPRDELNSLIATCDCYVSLHRSEGFGLTIAEAMSHGKPVIATSYSGNLDLMNAENSLLVRCEVGEIGASVRNPAYRPTDVWAIPDLGHAARLMSHVFADRKSGEEKGRRAQADIRSKFAPAAVGHRIDARIREIQTSLDDRPEERRQRATLTRFLMQQLRGQIARRRDRR